MMPQDDDGPLGAGQLGGSGVDRRIRTDDSAGTEPAVHIGPGVGRIGQDATGPGVGEPSPAQLARPRPAIGPLRKLAVDERPDHSIGRAGGLEGGKDVTDRGLHLFVGVHYRGSLVVVDQAHRKREVQVSPRRGGTLGSLEASGQDVQLRLRHLALQAQQEPVVEVGQVVDAVGIDHQCLGQAGKL